MEVENRRKICGVLGGMGPQATVDLLGRVIALTEADDDCDHVRCIIDQNPQVPSRVRALENGEPDPGPILAEMAKRLEAAGADYLCIPCNTAHNWLPVIESAARIPVLNMPALASELAAKVARSKKCGVMGTPSTRKQGVYEPHLQKRGLAAIYLDPDGERRLWAAINTVKAGRHGKDTAAELYNLAKTLVDAGAGVLILACTELGVLGLSEDVGAPVVDAADALAAAIVRESGARMKKGAS